MIMTTKLFDYFFGGKYKVCARFVPALITFLPLGIVFVIFFIRGMSVICERFDGYIQGWLNPCVKLCIALVIVFVWGGIVRIMAKMIEGVVFDEERGFPTTRMLLLRNDILPRSEKANVRAKLCREFQVTLMSLDDEIENPRVARDLIATAVKGARDKMRGSEMVLQYNILYGFVRNLTIGSLPALLASLVILYAGIAKGSTSTVFCLGVFLSAFYGIAVLSAKRLWCWAGNLYAKNLIREYLISK